MSQFANKVQWSSQLEDTDKIKFELLEDFFSRRHPNPGNDRHGEPFVRDYMTSEDIQDAMSEMVELDKDFIYKYMRNSDFVTVNNQGRMKWQIYLEK